MTVGSASRSRMSVTEVGDFLRNPPPGFCVESRGSDYRVRSDPEESLVLIDDFDLCRGRVVFPESLGRKVTLRSLREYSSTRTRLLSARIYLLVSNCGGAAARTDTTAAETRALQRYVVSIDGNHPFIRWQMEKGLDWTISSVAGESYRVDIDLSEALESWSGKRTHPVPDELIDPKPAWRDASFTLKYHSDALFDFPHWFGLSRRKFKLRLT